MLVRVAVCLSLLFAVGLAAPKPSQAPTAAKSEQVVDSVLKQLDAVPDRGMPVPSKGDKPSPLLSMLGLQGPTMPPQAGQGMGPLPTMSGMPQGMPPMNMPSMPPMNGQDMPQMNMPQMNGQGMPPMNMPPMNGQGMPPMMGPMSMPPMNGQGMPPMNMPPMNGQGMPPMMGPMSMPPMGMMGQVPTGMPPMGMMGQVPTGMPPMGMMGQVPTGMPPTAEVSDATTAPSTKASPTPFPGFLPPELLRGIPMPGMPGPTAIPTGFPPMMSPRGPMPPFNGPPPPFPPEMPPPTMMPTGLLKMFGPDRGANAKLQSLMDQYPTPSPQWELPDTMAKFLEFEQKIQLLSQEILDSFHKDLTEYLVLSDAYKAKMRSKLELLSVLQERLAAPLREAMTSMATFSPLMGAPGLRSEKHLLVVGATPSFDSSASPFPDTPSPSSSPAAKVKDQQAMMEQMGMPTMMPQDQLPSMMPQGQFPPMMPQGQFPPMMPQGQFPPMMGQGQPPMMGPTGFPPMMMAPGQAPMKPGQNMSASDFPPSMSPQDQAAMMAQMGYPPMMPQDQFPPMMQQGQFPPMMQQDQFPPMMQQDQFPPMMQQGRFPPMMQQDQFPPMMQQGRFPPMMQQGQFPPMMQQGQFPPMMQQDQFPPMMPQDQFPPMMQQGQFPPTMQQGQMPRDLSVMMEGLGDAPLSQDGNLLNMLMVTLNTLPQNTSAPQGIPMSPQDQAAMMAQLAMLQQSQVPPMMQQSQVPPMMQRGRMPQDMRGFPPTMSPQDQAAMMAQLAMLQQSQVPPMMQQDQFSQMPRDQFPMPGMAPPMAPRNRMMPRAPEMMSRMQQLQQQFDNSGDMMQGGFPQGVPMMAGGQNPFATEMPEEVFAGMSAGPTGTSSPQPSGNMIIRLLAMQQSAVPRPPFNPAAAQFQDRPQW